MRDSTQRSTKSFDCVQSLHALLPKIKILLCEDSSADCLLLRRELSRSGLEFDVTVVQTVEEMVSAMQDEHYHLILSDYHVPGYDITEAFQEVRRHDGDIPFIVMSGIAEESDVQALLHMGVSDFVSKHNPIRLVPSLCREIINTQRRVQGSQASTVLRGLEDKMYMHQVQEDLLHGVQKISFHTTGVEEYLSEVIQLLLNNTWLPFAKSGTVHTYSPVGKPIAVGYDSAKDAGAKASSQTSLVAGTGQIENKPYQEFDYLLNRGEEVIGTLCLQSNQGTPFSRQVTLFMPRLLDTVSEGLHNKLAEQKLQHQATHHELTNLPNKRYLLQQGDRLLRSSKDAEQLTQDAVVFVDIDNLKQTYDSLGSRISEALQVEVANRLSRLVPPEDFVSHLDSDLFCLVVHLDETSRVEHMRNVRALIHAVNGISEGAIEIDGNQIFVTVSIGAALNESDVDFETLLHRAELALHAARMEGRNSMRLFEHSLSDEANLRHQIEHDLRFAIERFEFELYYQPQVDPVRDCIVGCEALVRWNHPTRGLVSPYDFIPIAEESGQIHALGRWVLESACRQAKDWQDKGVKNFTMSVNISAAHFLQPGFVDQVKAALRCSGLPAHSLELEVTETVAMQISHMSQIVSMMQQLRDIGVSIAIDDFGTGFSSLSYVQKFPIEKLKVDRAFVKDVGGSDDGSLARSIILLAKNLNLQTVVEGVETEVQKRFFVEQECDLIQGYYYSKPLPSSEFYKLICHLN